MYWPVFLETILALGLMLEFGCIGRLPLAAGFIPRSVRRTLRRSAPAHPPKRRPPAASAHIEN
jgi:hypothetical protein